MGISVNLQNSPVVSPVAGLDALLPLIAKMTQMYTHVQTYGLTSVFVFPSCLVWFDIL